MISLIIIFMSRYLIDKMSILCLLPFSAACCSYCSWMDYWTNQRDKDFEEKFRFLITSGFLCWLTFRLCPAFSSIVNTVEILNCHAQTGKRKCEPQEDKNNISVKSHNFTHKLLGSLRSFHFGLNRSFSIKYPSNLKLYHPSSVTSCPTSCLFLLGSEVPTLNDDKRQYVQRLDLGPHMHQVAQIWYEKH